MNGITSNALKRSALHILTADGWLLFLTRFARLFAYGALSVVLVLYLAQLGLGESQTGLLLTLTLIGDTVVSFWLTTRADRMGRRRVLGIGALLMAVAGLIFASTGNLLLLVIAGTIGVISPSGNEVGPFLPIEQAALSHVFQVSREPLFLPGTPLPDLLRRLSARSSPDYWFNYSKPGLSEPSAVTGR